MSSNKFIYSSQNKKPNNFLPKIDYKEFEKVIKSRRSIRFFTSEIIPENVIKNSLDNALLAPNSSNLQVWEIYWVKNLNKKKRLVKACLSQAAASTAKELFVFVARPDNWKRNNKLMLDHIKKNNLNSKLLNYYSKITKIVYSQGLFNIFGLIKKILVTIIGLFRAIPREPTSFSEMKIWSQKSIALACQNFMLSMRAYGYDTCPMEGMDSLKVKKILNLPRKAQISMVIGAGKRDIEKGVTVDQIRFDKNLFIKMV